MAMSLVVVGAAAACTTTTEPASVFVDPVIDAKPAVDPGADAGAKPAPAAPVPFGEDITPGTAGRPNGQESLDAGSLPDGACAASVQRAKQLPLDIFLMLDSSGSMNETTSTGATKWASVRNALQSFLGDPASSGMGVALQFFPKDRAGISPTCTSSAQCGGGACGNRACTNAPTLTYCTTNSDCAGMGQCAELGTCSNSTTMLCFSQYSNVCPNGGGTCTRMASAKCADSESCNADDYSNAAVTFDTLPGVRPAILSAIDNRAPEGWTPTAAALSGALRQSKARATVMPNHTVATVLVTDGLPTKCEPTNINSVASVATDARAQAPAISTYVVGVFAPAESTEASANLDKIAREGGTNKAFMVTTGQDVAKELGNVLNAIRNTALSCEYQIPSAQSGLGTPSYDEINVRFTPSSGASVDLGRVRGVSGCTTQGGWYYDNEPGSSLAPSKIIACPTTCDAIKADLGAAMDVLVGCKKNLR